MAAQQLCNLTVDYSTVTGERILPFMFTLNESESNLTPEAGEYQKFCYDVVAKGEDNSDYADLSHFLLGICPLITQEQFASVTVTVDGQEKEVIWGVNVEIKTEDFPDNPTGCSGLKFDFPLNKVTGRMQVCFELTQVYAVGPINVCVYGGTVTATGLNICGPSCNGGTLCEDVFYQTETVCVPVTVEPYAIAGVATTTCCGDPVVTAGRTCSSSQGSICEFTITQKLCVAIPISFGAHISTGTAVVQCGTVSETECDCTTPPAESRQSNTTTRSNNFFKR